MIRSMARRKFSKHVDVFSRVPGLTETAEARIRADSRASYSTREILHLDGIPYCTHTSSLSRSWDQYWVTRCHTCLPQTRRASPCSCPDFAMTPRLSARIAFALERTSRI